MNSARSFGGITSSMSSKVPPQRSSTMFNSFADNLRPFDFLHGVYKSIAFGGAIAVSSCYFGVTVRGGAVGVGRAVNAAVVAAAVSIMLLDFFLTYLTG